MLSVKWGRIRAGGYFGFFELMRPWSMAEISLVSVMRGRVRAGVRIPTLLTHLTPNPSPEGEGSACTKTYGAILNT